MATMKTDDRGWFCYVISPMDIGWDSLERLADVYVKNTKQRLVASIDHGFGGLEPTDALLEDFCGARRLATECGWDGDFSVGPFVFYLPSLCQVKYGFAWKQDNNGETFVVSPVELSYLEEM